MKYCSKCGTELVDEAVVCVKCGCAVGSLGNEPEVKKKNAVALLGFILSFFFSIPGLILGIIGLVQSKKLKDGKGFSIAAICISAFSIICFIIMMVIVVAASVNDYNAAMA
ncbi:MAG: zinc ribbon domain-containing protein [Clostridia bacterium]|nr:zinc ribbon domain-containing protein [Clostridia bacterium]